MTALNYSLIQLAHMVH